MEEFIKEITKQIRNADMEFSHGLTVENTMVIGKMANNTVKAFT